MSAQLDTDGSSGDDSMVKFPGPQIATRDPTTRGQAKAKRAVIPTVYLDGRIGIRRFRPEDVSAHYGGIRESIHELSQWMVWCHGGYTHADAAAFVALSRKKWKQGEAYSFAIFNVEDGAVLGSVGLNGINLEHKVANLGYWVRSSRTRQGIAPQAARLVAQFGFKELGLNRLEFLIPVGNVASQRVAERAGARSEGILRSRLMLRKQPHDALIYSLVDGDLEHRW